MDPVARKKQVPCSASEAALDCPLCLLSSLATCELAAGGNPCPFRNPLPVAEGGLRTPPG